MSRILLLPVIALIVVFVLSGCEKTVSSPSNDTISSATSGDSFTASNPDEAAARDAYHKILQNEALFISTEENKSVYLKDFTYFSSKNYDDLKETRYTVVDMDGDNIPEMVVELTFDSADGQDAFGSEVLRYQDGNVYGYNFGYRCLQTRTLKTDGSFAYENEGDYVGYSKLQFDDSLCKYDFLAYDKPSDYYKSDTSTDSYYVHNEPAEKDSWDSFCDEQNGKENAAWQELTGQNGEDSVTPANPGGSDTSSDSPDAGTDAGSAIDAYTKVLQNESEFFCTEQNQPYTLKSFNHCKAYKGCRFTRFAKVDMDGDRIPEVLFEISAKDADGNKKPSSIEVLHYVDGNVYGYTFGIREMETVETDGTFRFSSGEADSGYAKLRFGHDKCETVELGHRESSITDRNGYDTELYYLNHKHVTKETYESFDNEQKNKEDIAWYRLTGKNIEKQLSAG